MGHFSDYDITNNSFNSETSQKNMGHFSDYGITNNSFNSVSQKNMGDYLQKQQTWRLFYQPPDDYNVYHITCRQIYNDETILQQIYDGDDYDYDYEFFCDDYNIIYHVTCKLLSHSLVTNILNREIYGRDFRENNLKRKNLLSSKQKLNLKLNLTQYLHISKNEMRLGCNENGELDTNTYDTDGFNYY
jgi:hypothetical protein